MREPDRRRSAWRGAALVFGPLGFGAFGALQFSAPSALGVGFLAAVIGPWVGLFSDAPYITLSFRMTLLGALTLAFGLVVLGLRARRDGVALPAITLGSALWTLAGAIGFGPQ